MYHVQYVVLRAIYLYLVLLIYSMNKCIRPPLGMKATEVNVVDQISVFKSFPSRPNFSVGTLWPKKMCLAFGDNKNKREILMRSGSFAEILRELVILQAMKNDLCKARARMEKKVYSKY